MKLLTFKTLWGQADADDICALEKACECAVSDGFDGVEGQIPRAGEIADQYADILQSLDLHYIAEICTAGSYVPDRNADLADHLADLERQLALLGPLKPLLVNCIGGCDGWPLETSAAFFEGAMDLAERFAVDIAFETHRGRSLYSPWVAERLLKKLALPLTCDFSHWCVVCEGLGPSEDDLIRAVAGCARHIHGRVGYDQGPQVSAPDSPLYAGDLEKHLRWWSWIWQAQRERGCTLTTVTPEFGPDGYQAVDSRTGEAVGDLNGINRWMAGTIRNHFQSQPFSFATTSTDGTPALRAPGEKSL